MAKRGCDHCSKAFGLTSRVFARQAQSVSYGGAGRTPDDCAQLYPMDMTCIARFCSSACAEPQLAALLEQQGLPAGSADKNLLGGPVYPCAFCATPVFLGAPHVAWVFAGMSRVRVGGRWPAMWEWMDMKAVVCSACSGSAQAAAATRGAAPGAKRQRRKAAAF